MVPAIDEPGAVRKSRHLQEYYPEIYGIDDGLGVEFFSKRGFNERVSKYDISVVKRVAFDDLKRDNNGHVRRNVIARRLKDIRNTGYPVSSYEGLGQDDLWVFLQDIRDKIRAEFLSIRCRCSRGSCSCRR